MWNKTLLAPKAFNHTARKTLLAASHLPPIGSDAAWVMDPKRSHIDIPSARFPLPPRFPVATLDRAEVHDSKRL